MKLLHDTHTLIWIMLEPEKLSATARDLLADTDNSLVTSIASLWEIAIKARLANTDLPVSNLNPVLEKLNAFRIETLAIKPAHLLALQRLPFHHRDPFDRILIAQSNAEQLPLLSIDKDIRKYDVIVHW